MDFLENDCRWALTPETYKRYRRCLQSFRPHLLIAFATRNDEPAMLEALALCTPPPLRVRVHCRLIHNPSAPLHVLKYLQAADDLRIREQAVKKVKYIHNF